MKLLRVSERLTILYAEYGYLELDGNAVVLRQGEYLTHFPVGSTCVVFIEPGTVVTHAAVKACAESGCLLLWVGEGGVRCYSAGNPGGASGEKILQQSKVRLDDNLRLQAARRIYYLMFREQPPLNRSVEQIRGFEGVKVKSTYAELAKKYGIDWTGRNQKNTLSDELNRAISYANSALYGISEAVILSLGFSPAIGVVHTGQDRSLVYDLADTVKFKTVVPLAMCLYAENKIKDQSTVRIACRDMFRDSSLIATLVENLLYIFEVQ